MDETTRFAQVKKEDDRRKTPPPHSALVVDDDPDVRTYVGRVLDEFGLSVSEAEDLKGARELLERVSFSLVFLDKCLPDGDGVEFARSLMSRQEGVHVVVITGQGSGEEAIRAMGHGVYDYLAKPIRLREVRDLVGRIMSAYAVENTVVAQSPADAVVGPVIVSRSKQMTDVLREVNKIARTSLPVLISGETGTGKEIIARKIHALSGASGPFVPVNCGAIPQELIESELFGHIKGSFTSADRDRPGLFEEAAMGTIFLDEITETSPAFQVKLLRVIQEGRSRRVGSNQEISLKNVRVIAASNQHIEDEVEKGKFRQDLYYRLKVCPLCLPPLRDRVEDIIPLAEHFANNPSDPNQKRRTITFSETVKEALRRYKWPGNVRELENVVDYAVQSCHGKVLISDLPGDLREAVGESRRGDEDVLIGKTEEHLPLREVERRYILKVLRDCGGNKTKAASVLGITRKTLKAALVEDEREAEIDNGKEVPADS